MLESEQIESVRNYFDGLGEGEWGHLKSSVHGRIRYAIHDEILRRHIAPGMHVANIGCGPGRFALDMLALGAELTLSDISGIQLNFAKGRIEGSGYAAAIHGYHQLDVTDMAPLAEDTFDAVVCFGGVLSYAREHYQQAAAELVRIAKPGAPILLSVMSLWGTLGLLGTLDAAEFLETRDDHLDWSDLIGNANVVLTRPGSAEFHQPVALFSSKAMRRILNAAGCDVVTMAAANPISGDGQALARIEASPAAEERLTELEIAICEEPGLVDAGQHLIVVGRRRT